MAWSSAHIHEAAHASSALDYALFEAIGLYEMEAGRVLDVGCFDGHNTVLKFGCCNKLSSIVGIDPLAAHIEQAKQRTDDPRFEWHVCSLEEFDAPQESFDVVYFSHVLQHMRDKKAALAKAHKLLKPGGIVAVKTVDDSCNMSYPDPNNLMKSVYRLYEDDVLPHTEHTRYTDRNYGHKCPSQLLQAGFEDIRVRSFLSDTSALSAEQRLKLFERTGYFRASVPASAGPDVAQRMSELLDAWAALFSSDEYYFAATTLLIFARKPADEPMRYHGPLFAERTAKTSAPGAPQGIAPMTENDLSDVMAIEMRSFPDPWVPLAYAMELRYNRDAHYYVLRNGDGACRGYVGWWKSGEHATIVHIAVDPDARRTGAGRALIEHACNLARTAGCQVMALHVRRKNAGARAFYRALGFDDIDTSAAYYTNPDDDAIIMLRPLAASTRPQKAG